MSHRNLAQAQPQTYTMGNCEALALSSPWRIPLTICTVVVLAVVAADGHPAVSAIGNLARRRHQVFIHARIVEARRAVEAAMHLARPTVMHAHGVFLAAAVRAFGQAGDGRQGGGLGHGAFSSFS